MQRRGKWRTYNFIWLYLCLFLLAGVLHYYDRRLELGEFNFTALPSLIYILLIVIWNVSIERRILQKNIKVFMAMSTYFMVFWFVLQTIRFRFNIEDLVVSRMLWYLYYIPMVMLPVFSFEITSHICDIKQKRIRKAGLYIIAITLIVLVITNDSHQMVFRLTGAIETGDVIYSYHMGYYLIVVFEIALIAITLIRLLYQCTILKCRRRAWMPFVPCVIIAGYLIWYAMYGRMGGVRKLFQLTEMFCFFIISLWEMCIQAGLIPSNSEHELYFEVSTINVLLADKDNKVVYRSSKMHDLDREKMQDAKMHPVMVDEDRRLSAANVSGGYIYWYDNLKNINMIKEQIQAVHEQLLGENELLKARQELEKKKVMLEQKNHLYDEIEQSMNVQIEQIHHLMDDVSVDDVDFRQRLSMACILNVYLKRRSNLMFIVKKQEMMDIAEVNFCILESIEYLKIHGVVCGFEEEKTGELQSSKCVLIYDFFEYVVETLLIELKELFIKLYEKEGNCILRIMTTDAKEQIHSTWKEESVKEEQASIDIEREDGTIYISLVIRGGER